MKIKIDDIVFTFDDETELWAGDDLGTVELLNRITEEADLFSVMPQKDLFLLGRIKSRIPEAQEVELEIEKEDDTEGEVIY